MKFTIRQVTKPTETELVKMSKMAATAFEGDGFLMAVIGANPMLNIPYHRAQLIAASIDGKIFVAEDASSNILGVALWFPPGTTMFSGEQQHRAAFLPFIQKCSPEIQQWWNDMFLVDHPKSSQQLIGKNLLKQAWQLELLAIDPQYQGKGIGSALVRDGQRRIFAEKKLIYLDTQKKEHVPFYQRLGFVLHGHQEFRSIDGGFSLFCMMSYWSKPAVGITVV
ncbi:hypothetical protein HGRIS_012603 [Hohenbuehelia grisea]|uniref:N-acetyltransferase domain-containing protein n=1 Tax=Hohenbuehelia grisea TaxID=104357 RepID=A0ABR3ISU5_9AGAR